jgi:hypothetical protein
MTLSLRSLSIISALTIVLAGCGQSTADKALENTIEKETGGAATVDTEDGTVQVTTSEGSFTAGTNTLPVDWPADIPVFKDAIVQLSGATNEEGEDGGSMAVLMTTEPAQAVMDYYTAALKENGWTIDSTMAAQGLNILTGTKDDRAITLSVTEAEGRTTITIGTGKK